MIYIKETPKMRQERRATAAVNDTNQLSLAEEIDQECKRKRRNHG
jgi:hypothetical protein